MVYLFDPSGSRTAVRSQYLRFRQTQVRVASSPTNHAVVAANAAVESMNFRGFAQMATSRHVLSSRIISTAAGSASASIAAAKIVNTDCRDISSR